MCLRTEGAAWTRSWCRWHVWSVKIFFVTSCIAIYFFFSVQIATHQEQPQQPATHQEQPQQPATHQEQPQQPAIQKKHENVWQYYAETGTLPKYFKSILLWTWESSGMYTPFYKKGDEQETFTALHCLFTQCYVTGNRMFFKGDLTKFDAILFDGKYLDTSDLPWQRSHNQQYIFYNMESADNYPVCEKEFDGFFNWTTTYRLDSDIPFPYILIRDRNGKIVGPKRKMVWEKMATVDNKVVQIPLTKTATAVWFVSNCKGRNGREKFAKNLKNALKPYNLTVDVIGRCGTNLCPKIFKSHCNLIIKNNYYFYMSLENSFAEDYVTEKLLTALQNDVVPIVYGGADYARFLPPGSYIDARKYSITELAAKMDRLIHSPKEYIQYFWWKKYYSYHNPTNFENVCALCEALHNEEMLNRYRSYNHFRDWWNPNKRCAKRRQ